MHVRKVGIGAEAAFELVDADGIAIPEVSAFLRHLAARGYSPNTRSAYAYDLLHLFQFFTHHDLSWTAFCPRHALALLEYLRAVPSRRPAQRLSPALAAIVDGRSATRLAPTTVNRILAAVSSFYEYLIVSGVLPTVEHPLQKTEDLAAARVPERYRPFLGFATKQRPIRRTVRVRTAQRLPRPLGDEQVAALLGSLRKQRDRAMLLLMLQGGLRPGEVLNLQLEDVQYGRQRVVIRWRADHPKGVRTKSRRERVVDLREPEALAALNAYVLQERPQDTDSPYAFLVGGKGQRRHDPLGYAALARLFARHCARLGIRQPWVTPHALRHTHATKLWEGGMRELALQRRLGHASPASTAVYTRVSDTAMVEEYVRALVRREEQVTE